MACRNLLLLSALLAAALLAPQTASAVPPAAPGNLKAYTTRVDPGTAGAFTYWLVTWDDRADDEAGYIVKVKIFSGSRALTGWQELAKLAPNTTSYVTENGLVDFFTQFPNAALQFQVTAFKQNGAKMEVSAGTTPRTPYLGTNSFSAPSDLKVIKLPGSDSILDVEFNDNSSTEIWHYLGYKKATDASFSASNEIQLGLFGQNKVRTALSLVPSTTYHFRVRARNFVTYTPYSNIFEITTEPLAPPTNLKVTAVDGTRVRLDWKDNSDNAMGYEMQYRFSATDPFQPLSSGSSIQYAGGDDTSYTVTVGAGTTTEWRIRGVFQEGSGPLHHSEFSNSATASTAAVLKTPTNVEAVATGLSGSIAVRWNNNDALTTVNRVLGRIVGGAPDFSVLAELPAKAQEVLIKSLTPDVQLEIVVLSLSSGGSSLPSDPVLVTPGHGFSPSDYVANLDPDQFGTVLLTPLKVGGMATEEVIKGVPFSHTLVITNSFARNSWSVTGLPAGFNAFDNALGVISGTAANAGIVQSPVSVVYGGGYTAQAKLVFRVQQPPASPVVEQPLAARTIGIGSPLPVALAGAFKDPDTPRAALLTTNLGDIKVSLFEQVTPQAVANFMGYVNGGDYDGVAFHRSFPPGAGPNNTVFALAKAPNGSILVAGDFTTYNGAAHNRLVLIRQDGSPDTTFNAGAGPNAAVRCMAYDSEGKLIIGGSFTTVSGVNRGRIAKLNASGSVDIAFAAGTGADGAIRAMALQGDKIYIGGEFQNYDDSSLKRIARLNNDGTVDPYFFTGTGANAAVNFILPLADGSVIVAGGFTTFNGQPRGGIAKLNDDGSLDSEFAAAGGSDGVVSSVIRLPDGKFLIAGDFEAYEGEIRFRVARLLPDGSLDDTFYPGSGADSEVLAMVVLPDGKPFVGGSFQHFNGTEAGRLMRLAVNGVAEPAFINGPGADGTVHALLVLDDGKVMVGGQFSTFNGADRSRLLRLNSNGSQDVGFNPGFVVQGGAFKPVEEPDKFASVAKRPSPRNEPGIGNYRGTLAAAKVGGDPNSATHDFFVNLGDNSANLDLQNSGFTVFGRIVGPGITVVDTISNLPTGSYSIQLDGAPGGTYSDWPMNDITAPSSMDIAKTVKILSAREISPLTYQVTANTAPGVVSAQIIDGQLSLNGLSPGSADITVTATDFEGNTASQVLSVQVVAGYQAVAIQEHPQAPAGPVAPGGSVTFSVNATGSDLSYQWRKDGQPLSGETGTALQLNGVTAASQGSYDVVVSNASNTVISQAAVLSLSQTALITSNPPSRILRSGQPLSLTVGVTGTPAPAVSWTRNGQATSVAGNVYAVPSATLADAGVYRALAQNAGGSQQSSSASVVVVDATPGKFLVKAGATLSLAVKTAQPAGAVLNYQWKNKDGQNVVEGPRFSGANKSKLTIKGITVLEAGEYTCQVTGTMGSVQSGAFDVIVAATPVVPEITLPEAYVAQAYEFTLPVDAVAKSSAPSRYTVSGLPAGLVFDSAAGRIHGVPTRRGAYNVKVTAINPQGSASVIAPLNVVSMPVNTTGVFAGLLARHEQVNQSSGGRVDLTITDSGSYTGKVTLPGKTHAIRGKVTRSIATIASVPTVVIGGEATVKQKGQPDRVLKFSINSNNATLSGELALNNDNKSGLTGWKNVWHAQYAPTTDAAALFDETYHFAMDIPAASVGNAAIPQGSGYAALKVSSSGTATVTGRTIDGKPLLCSAPLGPAGSFFVFQLLYNHAGSVLGPLAIAKRDADLNGGLSHSEIVTVTGFSFDHAKKPVANTRDYPLGFGPVSLSVLGGTYRKPGVSARNAITRLAADGQRDLLFNDALLANSTILKMVSQADGKVVIAGTFSRYGGVSRNGVARLTANGLLDESFNPGTGANGAVFDIALQPDGKVIVVGSFTQFNGVARNRVARLNDDGSVDSGFDPGTGPNSTVECVAVQGDGKILIGGQFGSLNGTTRQGIARLNDNGAADTTFNAGGVGVDAAVRCVTLQSDQKILLGGDFTTYNQSGSTLTRPRILRLNIDGTVDTAFSPGSGANNTVRAIRVQANGAILIGGSFTAINGIGRNNLARLLGSNGSLDTTFNIGTGVNGHVFAIAIMPSGNIAFGGSFSRFNTSIVRNGVVILTPTGGVDTDFEPPAGEAQNNENNSVRSLLEQNGKLLVSGWVRVRDKLDRMMWLTDSKNQADMLFTEGGLAGAAFNPNAVVTLSAKNIGKVEQPNDALTTWSYNASTGLISGQFKPDNSGVKRTAKYNALLIPVTPSDVIGLGSFDLIEQPNGTTITSGNALIHTGRVKIAPKP